MPERHLIWVGSRYLVTKQNFGLASLDVKSARFLINDRMETWLRVDNKDVWVFVKFRLEVSTATHPNDVFGMIAVPENEFATAKVTYLKTTGRILSPFYPVKGTSSLACFTENVAGLTYLQVFDTSTASFRVIRQVQLQNMAADLEVAHH